MANDVKVIISQRMIPGKLAFGIPLILASMQESSVPYTTCTNMNEVKKLFPEGTPVYKAAFLLFQQSQAPAKIAVCGSTEKATTALAAEWDKDWRQLMVVSGGSEEKLDDTLDVVSNFVESKKDKVFFVRVKNISEIVESMKQNERTVVVCYNGITETPEAALIGASAGLDTGSFTYKNLILSGVETEVLSDTDMETIHQANAMCIITKAGDVVTSEGKVLSGEYTDIVDSKDYIISNIEYNIQKILNSSSKVPYDNNGIAMLESATINVLKDAYNKGIIATNDAGLPDYSTNFLTRSETEASDRIERKYIGGSFTFTIAGAIHNVEIHGELVY